MRSRRAVLRSESLTVNSTMNVPPVYRSKPERPSWIQKNSRRPAVSLTHPFQPPGSFLLGLKPSSASFGFRALTNTERNSGARITSRG